MLIGAFLVTFELYYCNKALFGAPTHLNLIIVPTQVNLMDSSAAVVAYVTLIVSGELHLQVNRSFVEHRHRKWIEINKSFH